MFNNAYRPYYPSNRNEYLSLPQVGMGVWTNKADQAERWLSPVQIRRLTKKLADSQKREAVLQSEQPVNGGDTMFDTRKVGQRIAMLRKAKDLTQMEVADKMMVSYQAVSNWERGNSMPDISKLADLADLFGVSMEELLGSKRESDIIAKVTRSKDPVSLEEVAEVAPVLKPSQVDEASERSGQTRVEPEALEQLAPYFSEEKLGDWAERMHVTDLSQLIGLAPFLSRERLGKLVRGLENTGGSLEHVIALAPFLQSEDLGRLVNDKLDQGADVYQVIGLAPFLNREQLSQLAMRLSGAGVDASQLAALAPFLDGDTLSRLLEGRDPGQLREHVLALAPFMKSTDLTRIAREVLKAGDLKTFTALLPFIDTDEL